jgi:hypothetical protein
VTATNLQSGAHESIPGLQNFELDISERLNFYRDTASSTKVTGAIYEGNSKRIAPAGESPGW